MSAMHRFSVKGFYKEQFCRSLHEFHACLYLDKVKKVEFITEPFSMRSEINSKRKIPDIMYFDHIKRQVIIAEVKPTFNDALDVIISYAENKFRCPAKFIEIVKSSGYTINYEFLVNTKVAFKKDIIEAIGMDEYLNTLAEYRNQEQTHTGFPGKLNPMYGRKHSLATKAIIATTASHPGEKNGMYGKTHTTVAKAAVGAKWYSPATRNAILRNSLLNRLEKLNNKQYAEYISYCINVLRGEILPNPVFMNGITKISDTRVIQLFGSYANFWHAIRITI